MKLADHLFCVRNGAKMKKKYLKVEVNVLNLKIFGDFSVFQEKH
jgi:hypothetical protein